MERGERSQGAMAGEQATRGRRARGQVAMEYLLISGFAFAMLMPIIIIFVVHSQSLNRDVTASQVSKIEDELMNAIETVYYHGAPTTKTFSAFMPQYVSAAAVDGRRVTFTIQASGTGMNITRDAVTDLEGTLSPSYGMNTFRVEALPNGTVRVSNS